MMQRAANLDHERAERLMAMGQMAASLAHEIRNPLGSMELYCSLLKKDLQNQPDALLLAENIHSGIRTLDRIITNCLQFSRDVTPKRVDLGSPAELFKDVLDFVSADAEAQGVALSLKSEGEGPVQVDRYQMQQVLLNLVRNAIDAASGSAEGHVIITSRVLAGKRWEVEVCDNGPGIDQRDMGKIFDPFFSTKPKGTGLGLAIVHSLVAAHGGSISLESELGQGTKVLISIPLQEATEELAGNAG